MPKGYIGHIAKRGDRDDARHVMFCVQVTAKLPEPRRTDTWKVLADGERRSDGRRSNTRQLSDS